MHISASRSQQPFPSMCFPQLWRCNPVPSGRLLRCEPSEMLWPVPLSPVFFCLMVSRALFCPPWSLEQNSGNLTPQEISMSQGHLCFPSCRDHMGIVAPVPLFERCGKALLTSSLSLTILCLSSEVAPFVMRWRVWALKSDSLGLNRGFAACQLCNLERASQHLSASAYLSLKWELC